MKSVSFAVAGLVLFLSSLSMPAASLPPEPVVVSDLAVQGAIVGENVSFTLSLCADVETRDARLVLAEGDLTALAGSELPKGSELVREGKRYVLKFDRKGRQAVRLEFASLAARAGEWRVTHFVIPESSVRHLSILCDRADLDIEFPGALGVERRKAAGGKT
jgi:hypothetical protein